VPCCWRRRPEPAHARGRKGKAMSAQYRLQPAGESSTILHSTCNCAPAGESPFPQPLPPFSCPLSSFPTSLFPPLPAGESSTIWHSTCNRAPARAPLLLPPPLLSAPCLLTLPHCRPHACSPLTHCLTLLLSLGPWASRPPKNAPTPRFLEALDPCEPWLCRV